MRPAKVMILSALLGSLLSACATRDTSPASPTMLASASECPELEGHPDCQDGQLVQ